MKIKNALIITYPDSLIQMTLAEHNSGGEYRVTKLSERLLALIPDLEHGRETHRDWGAYLANHPKAL